jgi:predicted nucleic acid-binding Zn ribbon protein
MRRKQTEKISDLLKEFAGNAKFEGKLNETRIIENWSKLFGPMISNSTQKIFISNRVLFVYLDSPIIKNELFMMRTRILDALNESTGSKTIDNIVFK